MERAREWLREHPEVLDWEWDFDWSAGKYLVFDKLNETFKIPSEIVEEIKATIGIEPTSS